MKKLISAGAALMLALGLAGAAVAAPFQKTATLPLLDETAVQATFATATTPIGVLVVNDKCATCSSADALLAKAAAKHPQMKFIKTVDDVSEPAFIVLVPGIGPSFQLENFQPTAESIDAFLNKRVEVATAEAATATKMLALKTQLENKAKPFDAQLDAIKAQAATALAPYAKKLNTLKAKSDAAAKPFADEAAAIEAKMEAAEKPFADKLAELEPKLEALVAPIQAKAKPINDAIEAAGKGLVEELKAAQAAGDQEKFKALQAQLKTLVEPYLPQVQALQAEAEAAAKPFASQIKNLEKQKEAATAVLKVQHETAELNAKLATMPFDQDIADAKAAAETAAAPFKEKVQPIAEARQAALTPIAAEIQKLAASLQSMLEADQPK